ncbi:uncharacterized protein EV420DRAFT_437214 [Desarmillaria tabescens]|uniref:Protein byr4 n=1 Tax=Armillaria tabescens TaxID=1929756 RepID=A0AA39NLQ8_ARMTA|nr:uncharacterized protein EV420DRAFT_437214 [Desarmillaria tabescens]KAK0467964.1 hypothetical protein EV420DRAFT_437214 [Desarmillaria tabescens]
MSTIPAPTAAAAQEEWPDADFDLPEGQSIHTVSKDEEDEDWDLEMDLGHTGGAQIHCPFPSHPDPSGTSTQMRIIRPLSSLQDFDDDDDDNDDDEEGASTIKFAAVPKPKPVVPPTRLSDENDFEDAFSLPSGITRLSLAPLTLNHRASKTSLEWGDKDQTTSSQSSDAYSTLGFADTSPSSNSTSSVSTPGTETEEDDDDEGDLEGLIIPADLGRRHFTSILNKKKTAVMMDNQVKVASPDPDDDFEMGLVIDDNVDFSPSRLLKPQRSPLLRSANRSSSLLLQKAPRLPSRVNRAKSPVNHPPVSSARQLQKLRLSPSPPLQTPARTQTFQSFSPKPSSTLPVKTGSLRGQKSHTGLAPAAAATPVRRLARKASLSSLMESGAQASAPSSPAPKGTRYGESTAASRAKSHKASTSQCRDYEVPPTRPSTPSSSTAALRLTIPTIGRLKSRPALSALFGRSPSPRAQSPFRTSSPAPARPPSNLSKSTRTIPPQLVPKVLRKPKRQCVYGDGTELDAIADLPTDRDKESRFRVQPKGYGNRIAAASFSPTKLADKSAIRKKGRREPSDSTAPSAFASLSKRRSRSELAQKPQSPKKKRKNLTPSTEPKKPTLIRNLGGTSAPKVVGDMKWNPQTLRWEGNEQVLKDFDVAFTRPALITHLTGSSLGSPAPSYASGARIVGNMIFDPARMCWISTLPPEDEEPDVFANLADDEEEGDGWETKGGTIKAVISVSETSMAASSVNGSSVASAPTSGRCRARAASEADSERFSRASMVCDIDGHFVQKCREAETRHHSEMKGWKSTLSRQDTFTEPDRSFLYDIRTLATRKY